MANRYLVQEIISPCEQQQQRKYKIYIWTMGKADRAWLMGCAGVEINLGDSKRQIWGQREMLGTSQNNFCSI